MTTISMPDPDDASTLAAEAEAFLAAQLPGPAPPAAQPAVDGRTRRVQRLSREVAEAHQLADLQDDPTPLEIDTDRVRKRRRRVAEAARLHVLAQDPRALAYRDQRIRRLTTVMVMAAAVIALAVSAIGVQFSVAKGLHLVKHSPAWWAAFGIEPTMSLPLLAVVSVQAYSAMRGRVIDRRSEEGKRMRRTECLLLALVLLLNVWPALAGLVEWAFLPLVVHALGPIAAVVAVWTLPTIWAVLGALPLPHTDGGTPGAYSKDPARRYPNLSVSGPVDITALTERTRRLIASGELPADPGIHKIRTALRVGTDTARSIKAALSEH